MARGNPSTRPPTRKQLPPFVDPMLALLVEPFESSRHLYEVKWDGFRAQLRVDAGGHQLTGRSKTNYTARYPELEVLAKLSHGTILDGEIVQLAGGRPDFQSLLSRERSWSSRFREETRDGLARRHKPVTFVAFDLLYDRYRSVMAEPLEARRERLETLLGKAAYPRLVLSEARIGHGLELYKRVNELALEGVIAKRLGDPYEPGCRSGSWSKFKRRQHVVCAIIGYLVNSTGGLTSLLLAADVSGEPRFVGKVGTGIPASTHSKLLRQFRDLAQSRPALPCSIGGARWVRPELFCRVSFMEWTKDRKLRTPVFDRLL